jgi:hypothetical protein
MKSRIVLVELLLLCALLISCSSTGNPVVSEENMLITGLKTDEMNKESDKDLKNLSVKKLSFQDDNVLIVVEPAGDRMYLSCTNNSSDRIILHIESARVTTMEGDDTSQIVTFEQSKQNTSHFSVSAIVVNPGITFTEKYVALDSMEYDAFKSHRYVIKEWAKSEAFHLSISYGLVTFKGEIVKDLIIN